MNKEISGVDANDVNPAVDDTRNVVMQESQDTYSRGEEQKPLKNFVSGNEEKAARPRPGR